MASSTKPPEPPPPGVSPRTAYLTGNLIRLGGLAIALNEALVREEDRASAFALAAFMLAGAQGIDTFLDRLFGGPR